MDLNEPFYLLLSCDAIADIFRLAKLLLQWKCHVSCIHVRLKCGRLCKVQLSPAKHQFWASKIHVIFTDNRRLGTNRNLLSESAGNLARKGNPSPSAEKQASAKVLLHMLSRKASKWGSAKAVKWSAAPRNGWKEEDQVKGDYMSDLEAFLKTKSHKWRGNDISRRKQVCKIEKPPKWARQLPGPQNWNILKLKRWIAFLGAFNPFTSLEIERQLY